LRSAKKGGSACQGEKNAAQNISKRMGNFPQRTNSLAGDATRGGVPDEKKGPTKVKVEGGVERENKPRAKRISPEVPQGK